MRHLQFLCNGTLKFAHLFFFFFFQSIESNETWCRCLVTTSLEYCITKPNPASLVICDHIMSHYVVVAHDIAGPKDQQKVENLTFLCLNIFFKISVRSQLNVVRNVHRFMQPTMRENEYHIARCCIVRSCCHVALCCHYLNPGALPHKATCIP